VIRRRGSNLWLSLWLIVVFCTTAYAHALPANSLLGSLRAPAGSQGPVQPHHEEDEHQTAAKLVTVKALGRRMGRILASRGVSVLPALPPCECPARTPSWDPFASVPVPLSLFLNASLSHRGPPSC
jgi:hypothetical protein